VQLIDRSAAIFLRNATVLFSVFFLIFLLCLPPDSALASGYAPSKTSYTGIDPGKGLYYTYAPSILQEGSTRFVFYCGNRVSNVIHDNVFLSVGIQRNGRYSYSKPRVVLGPRPGTFYAFHTCEPSVIQGSYRYAGVAYSLAMFFTAESTATNSTNQIGVAFANAPSGPWIVDPFPIVKTSDDFGKNNFPNDCPTDAQGQTLYCLGEPATVSLGGGKVLLTHMGNAGSPGSNDAPSEGLTYDILTLSNVPGNAPCNNCFSKLSNGKYVAAVPTSGLGEVPQDAAIALTPDSRTIVLSYDSGPRDSNPSGPPVTPYLPVATMPLQGFLNGMGTWTIRGYVGQCLSGYTYNHNSGFVTDPTGRTISGMPLTIYYAIADNDLGSNFGVWDYRIWQAASPLRPGGPSTTASLSNASARCPGLTVVATNGHVVSKGSNYSFNRSVKLAPSSKIVGIATTGDRGGYYLAASNGQLFSVGDAQSLGRLPRKLPSPVVGLAVDATNGGYWVALENGNVYGFNAPFGRITNVRGGSPVVAIDSIPNGAGYYLLRANGVVSSAGNAQLFGNAALPASETAVALAVTPDGLGYYVALSDGSIQTFGDAVLFGAPASRQSPPVGISVSQDGFGYWVLYRDGTVEGYGDAANTFPSSLLTGSTAAAILGF
jgi:hypothetical protein